MGVGPLQIGINQGAAQILAPNTGVQDFTNILAQRKAKVDADNKYLSDQLGSVKPDGLRNDADRTNFYNKYAQIKQQAIDAQNLKDPKQRAMAIANVKQGMLDLDGYVNQSKQQAAKENSFAQQYMANPSAYSDAAIEAHRKGIASAVDNPSVVSDYTTLARQPDLVKLDTRLNKVRDDQLDGIKGEEVITGRKKVGNKMINQLATKYTADPTDVTHAYLNEYDINPDFQHLLQKKYGDQIPQGANPVAVKAALVGAYTKDLGEVSKYKQKDITDFQPRVPRKGSGEGEIPATPIATQNLPFAGGGNTNVGNFNMHGYVPISVPNKNFAGVPAIDLKTGQPVPALKSSSDYAIVGVGNAPFIKNGDNKVTQQFIGKLSQPSYEQSNPQNIEQKPMIHVQSKNGAITHDYLIPYDRLPENIKNSKPIREALSGFKPATNTAEMVTMTLPDGTTGQIPHSKVADFLKKYPNAKKH